MQAFWKSGRPPIFAFALLLIAYATVYQCFSERAIYFDEVGLHNPVYMYVNYGKMTYPAHEQFDAMFVHPPTMYFLTAVLMKFGNLSVFHAAGLLSVLLFAAFAMIVVFSRFPIALQAGLLFGCFLGTFVWAEALVLRPDVALGLSWFAGLAALESARLSGWDIRRLVLGGFFLALATAMHYPGVAAVLGLVVYAIWLAVALRWAEARKRIGWMLGGACLVGIPYLIFFLLPHLREVIGFSLAVEGAATSKTAYQGHLEAYRVWRDALPYWMNARPVSTALVSPLFRWAVPAAFVAPGLLLVLPASRGLAMASLPHLLFLLFIVRHKQIGYSGYFIPEVSLYFVAVTSVALSALFVFINRVGSRFVPLSALAITGTLALLASWDVPALDGPRVLKTRGIYDLEAGREAGRRILGRNAVVGTSSAGVWYTCGATHLYFVTPELVYPPDLSCFDERKYLGFFDALAADPQQSWAAYSRQHASITSAYVDGLLQMRGFFFADRRVNFESGLSYLLFAVRPTKVLTGFGVRGSTVFQFREDPGGDEEFMSATCPVNATEASGELNNSDLNLDFYVVHFLPVPSNEDPRSLKDQNISAAIVSLMTDRTRFEKDIQNRLGRCKVRDAVRGQITKEDLYQFVDDLRKDDEVIRFYRSYDAFRSTVGKMPGRGDLLETKEIVTACPAVASTPSQAP